MAWAGLAADAQRDRRDLRGPDRRGRRRRADRRDCLATLRHAHVDRRAASLARATRARVQRLAPLARCEPSRSSRSSASRSQSPASRERLSDEQRQAIAEAMVTDVLSALATSRELAGVLVITNEDLVVPIAERLGAQVEPDSREGGQSAAATIGIERALRDGFERVLLLPGDCPALDRDELDELLSRPREPVVIVPDRHGTGTNALLLAPPGCDRASVRAWELRASLRACAGCRRRVRGRTAGDAAARHRHGGRPRGAAGGPAHARAAHAHRLRRGDGGELMGQLARPLAHRPARDRGRRRPRLADPRRRSAAVG